MSKKSSKKEPAAGLRIYNSLTKHKELFKPIDNGNVRMYSCGPTIYASSHIGNLTTFIRDDVLRRTLSATGYKVRHVMNLTDVDDKTIRDSCKVEFRVDNDPMQSLKNITTKYHDIFMQDIAKIGNDVESIEFISATDSIDEMIDLINKMLKNNLAYKAEDGIYFSIQNYVASGNEYGVLQHVELGKNVSRINNDEYEKESAADFALWKAKSEGEPFWAGRFEASDGVKFNMDGRPGWHIECSAMSNKLLSTPFDIHTGGIDLKFPHHENEIAQSIAALGCKSQANYFVHMSHILVDGRKMSKSLGNFYTLQDLESRGFKPAAFRLLVLSSNYQKKSNFSWDILEAAQNRLNNWSSSVDLLWQDGTALNSDFNSSKYESRLYSALQDNLDTPKALAVIDDAMSKIAELSIDRVQIEQFVKKVHNLLGIDLVSGKSDITEGQKGVLLQRQKARDDEDFTKSDQLRDALLKEHKLAVRDTPNGQVWSRV